MRIKFLWKTDVDRCLLMLERPEAAAWRSRLARLRSDCGCRMGSIVMLMTTAGWTLCWWQGRYATMGWRTTAVTGAGALFGSAVIGKILGLVVARLRFQLAALALRRLTMRSALYPGTASPTGLIRNGRSIR